ncbi:unnamed protein product [Nesidiocoris tenuis]|uniref:Uncharacterized protein n=1 Tax=Nesidiocoris tenuis TaxID=355587 RepID=A0A6H5GJR3_9HEMI|nr:unnamed protein product [Nesidiocoris tenuis]
MESLRQTFQGMRVSPNHTLERLGSPILDSESHHDDVIKSPDAPGRLTFSSQQHSSDSNDIFDIGENLSWSEYKEICSIVMSQLLSRYGEELMNKILSNIDECSDDSVLQVRVNKESAKFAPKSSFEVTSLRKRSPLMAGLTAALAALSPTPCSNLNMASSNSLLDTSLSSGTTWQTPVINRGWRGAFELEFADPDIFTMGYRDAFEILVDLCCNAPKRRLGSWNNWVSLCTVLQPMHKSMIPFVLKQQKEEDPEVVKGYEDLWAYAVRFYGIYPKLLNGWYYVYGIYENTLVENGEINELLMSGSECFYNGAVNLTILAAYCLYGQKVTDAMRDLKMRLEKPTIANLWSMMAPRKKPHYWLMSDAKKIFTSTTLWRWVQLSSRASLLRPCMPYKIKVNFEIKINLKIKVNFKFKVKFEMKLNFEIKVNLGIKLNFDIKVNFEFKVNFEIKVNFEFKLNFEIKVNFDIKFNFEFKLNFEFKVNFEFKLNFEIKVNFEIKINFEIKLNFEIKVNFGMIPFVLKQQMEEDPDVVRGYEELWAYSFTDWCRKPWVCRYSVFFLEQPYWSALLCSSLRRFQFKYK